MNLKGKRNHSYSLKGEEKEEEEEEEGGGKIASGKKEKKKEGHLISLDKDALNHVKAKAVYASSKLPEDLWATSSYILSES